MKHYPLPTDERLKDHPVGCSGCGERAPFTLREYEQGPQPIGWQLRLIGTELLHEGEVKRSWRWDLYCPACSGEASPFPRARGVIRVKRR